MRELIVRALDGSTEQVSITCPAGKRLRVLAVIATMSGTSLGDQARLTMGQTGRTFAEVGTGALNPGVTRVAANLGGAQNVTWSEANVDPASGDVDPVNNQLATLELPDIWWPFDVLVAVTADGAIASLTSVVYELDGPPLAVRRSGVRGVMNRAPQST